MILHRFVRSWERRHLRDKGSRAWAHHPFLVRLRQMTEGLHAHISTDVDRPNVKTPHHISCPLRHYISPLEPTLMAPVSNGCLCSRMARQVNGPCPVVKPLGGGYTAVQDRSLIVVQCLRYKHHHHTSFLVVYKTTSSLVRLLVPT